MDVAALKVNMATEPKTIILQELDGLEVDQKVTANIMVVELKEDFHVGHKVNHDVLIADGDGMARVSAWKGHV